MQYHYTPFIFPLIIAAIISGWVAAYAFSRRTVPGSLALAVLGLAIAEWSIGYSLEIAGADLATKLIWGEVQYAGIVTIPLLWFLFCYDHAYQDKPLRLRTVLLLSIVPAITFLLVLSTGSHGLIWLETHVKDTGNLSVLGVTYGPWFWVHSLYSYALLLAGTIITIRSIGRTKGLYRGQSIILVISAFFPWVGNALYLLGVSPIPGLDLTPFMFTVTVVGMTLGIYGFRLIDLTPIARDLVVEEMLDGMIVVDVQGRIVDINPAAQRLLGQSAFRLIGQSAEKVLSDWHLPVGMRQIQTEFQQEITIGDEESRRAFDIRFSPLNNRAKRSIGRVILIRDITDRKKAEQELAIARDQAMEASRLKSQLLTMVSHELRTPLGGILGYAELLESNAFGPLTDQQKQATVQILDSTHYLALMVNELLDQAQLEAKVVKIRKEPLSLTDLLQKIDTAMAVLAHHKGLTFTTSLSPDMPETVLGDTQRLQQILFNLVGNSIKFTRTGGVSVKIFRPDPGFWAIQVTDTGAGIPEAARAVIFEPFRQVDNAMTRENRGTGLGLSITKQLVEMMDGTVHLESEVGKGSTFTILLPLAEEEPTAGEQPGLPGKKDL